MPITANCGNCGKTYQAPDRMAGKSVRCKQCGEIFRIDAGDIPTGEAGMPDLDALERSFSGEEMGTSSSTAVGGPTVDAKGKVRIDRASNVDDIALHGAAAKAMRSNYRFRYPGAKQVDQFLPWVLVALTGFVLFRACANSYSLATGDEGPPTTGVAVSRFAVLVAAYLFLVWPASHIALRMATTRLRTSLPRGAAWRSFAAFTPVALLGAGLYLFSGGSPGALIFGLILGAAVAIGTVTLLFRLFPGELPVASAYIAGGTLGGGAFAAATIFAINLVGSLIAGYEKNPQQFVSPIAVGLKWVDKPAPPAPKPLPAPQPVVEIADNTPTTGPTTEPVVSSAPVPIPLQPIAVPRVGDAPPLAKKIEATPVTAGFEEILVPPVGSSALAAVRSIGAAGGDVEVWDTSDWSQPIVQHGRNFTVVAGTMAVDTRARRVVRLVSVPVLRVEDVPLGNRPIGPSLEIPGGRAAKMLGFVREGELFIRTLEGNHFGVLRYDARTGQSLAGIGPMAIKDANGAPQPMEVSHSTSAVRLLPDGSGVVLAGRNFADGTRATLAVFPWNQPDAPSTVHRIPWGDSMHFRPTGLALRGGRKAALLLDAGGEAYLTIWELNHTADGIRFPAQQSALLDRKLGAMNAFRTAHWDEEQSDPVLWIDDQTLLLFGNTVVDARTGNTLGTLGLTGITAQYRGSNGAALLVRQEGRINTLIQVTFDPDAIESAHARNRKSRGE